MQGSDTPNPPGNPPEATPSASSGLPPAPDTTRCARCTADISDLAPLDPCPYCGTQAAASRVLPAGAISPLPTRTITDSYPCLACGYDLKGLDAFGHCPECGHLVQDSLAGPLLRHAAPAHIHLLSRGALLGSLWAGMSAMLWAPNCLWTIAAPNAPRVGSFIAIPAIALLAGACWLLTSRDEGLTRSFPGERTRRRLRALGVALASLTIADHLYSLSTRAPRAFFELVNSGPWVGTGISWVKMIVAWAFYFALMSHLRWLARRAADQKLRDEVVSFTWLVALLYFPGVLALGLGAVAACILMCILFNSMRRRLSAVRAEAEERQRVHAVTAS